MYSSIGVHQAPSPPDAVPFGGRSRELGNNVGSGDRARANRRAAWSALGWLWSQSTLESVQCCRRSSITGDGVSLGIGDGGQAKVLGARTCGSVWSCPVCSQRVWAERANKLVTALRSWSARDGSVAMLTLTMRHDRSQALSDLWPELSSAWRAVEQSRSVRAVFAEAGSLGFVRRIEATHGANGWHLHIHALVFLDHPPSPEQLESLEAAAFSAWSSRLAARGMGAPTRAHGADLKLLDLSAPEAAVAGYITTRATPETTTTAALELSDSIAGKRAHGTNRSTWDILTAAVGGDRRSRRLWREWEQASKGKRALTWGHSLKGLLGDLDDEVEPPTVDRLVTLADPVWRAVCNLGRVPDLLEAAEDAYALQETHDGGLLAAAGDVVLLLEDWGLSPP